MRASGPRKQSEDGYVCFFLRLWSASRIFNSFKLSSFISHDEQRLARRSQQIEELAGFGPCVDFLAVGQQRDGSAAANGVEQADAEPAAQRVEQLADLRHRQPAAPQIRQHRQLEQIDRRIPALGVAAGLRFGASPPTA